MTQAPRPVISVVIVTLQGRESLVHCLTALVQQGGVTAVEIIVPYDARLGDVSAVRAQFPGVQFVSLDGARTYAELRACGVRRAQGEIVALTEDHCTPSPDWCAQIVQVHAGPYAAVGGAVDKDGPDTAVNWALYLADYGRYMRPMPEGEAVQLTDCNVSYKRRALDAIAGVWCDEFHEPTVHAALRERGETLWFSPRILVHQRRDVRLGSALRDRYVFGRLFGGGRVARQSALRRLPYLGFALVVPALLVGRVALTVATKRRCLGAFVHAFPALVLLCVAWACGEFVGYCTGRPGPSLTPAGVRNAAPAHAGHDY